MTQFNKVMQGMLCRASKTPANKTTTPVVKKIVKSKAKAKAKPKPTAKAKAKEAIMTTTEQTPSHQHDAGYDFPLVFFEDNTAAIAVMKSGKNPQIRHMNRTHQVSHRWLHEIIDRDPAVTIRYCDTKEMKADLMTKAFYDGSKFQHAISLVGLISDNLAPLT